MSVEEQLEAAYDSGGHPTADTIAGLDLDSFDAATTAHLQTHISGCDRCRAVLGSLRRSTGALTGGPMPPMPADVFAQLQSTIRTEQARRSGPNVVDLSAERSRRRRRTQWIGAAAAGVAVIAAVGITIGVTSGGDQNGTGQYAGPQPSSVVPSGELPGSANPGPGSTAAAYTRQNLRAAVPRIVRSSSLNLPGVKVSPAGAMQNPQKRAACVAALGEKRALVAVQQVTFEGRLSFVFVFDQHASSAPNVRVVGPACGNGTADERFSTHGSY